jgi:trehalose 6-phosphate synthase/phosphatase
MTQWDAVIKMRQHSQTKLLSIEDSQHIMQDIESAQNALLILDYDGTLVPFFKHPDDAVPTTDLKTMLRTLNDSPNINVVIVSGRTKESLDTFFADLDIDIIAEHGAWIGAHQGEARQWHATAADPHEWKDKVRNILEQYMTRTPGSFIEEKAFSLVWHYRQSDVGLGQLRAHELTETLNYITANLNLHVLEGSKIVEVKDAGIDKGAAVQQLVADRKPDFTLVAGDDVTDEDMFRALPETCSIKIGMKQSAAQYNLKSQESMIELLQQITERIKHEKTN